MNHHPPVDAAESGFALSCLQESMSGRADDSCLRIVLRLDGGVDPAVLQAALAELTSDWEVLRTQFGRDADGRTAQWPTTTTPALSGLDLPDDLASEERALACFMELAEPLVNGVPTDWTVPTACWRDARFILIKLSSVSFDHISAALLAKALGRALDGSELPAVVQFADLVAWMDDVDHALPPPLNALRQLTRNGAQQSLPLFETAGATPLSAPALVTDLLEPLACERLRELGQRHAAPLDDIVMTLYAATLLQAGGYGPLTFGVLDNCRGWVELEECPGRLAGITPTDLAGDPDAGMPALLTQLVQARTLRMAWAQRFDLTRHTLELGIDEPAFTFGSEQRSPRQAVSVALWSDSGLPGKLHLQFIDGAAPTLCWQHGAQLGAKALDLLRGRWFALLHAWWQDEALSLAAPGLLGAREQALLATRQATTAAPDSPLFTARFAEAVRNGPQAPALCGADFVITYAQLQTQAAAIAGALRAGGIAPGARVALVARSPRQQVAGLLGVLQAGCVFVPLDPDWPVARRHAICADAGAEVVLDDDNIAALSLYATPVEESDADGTAAAYLVYTSGSSGTPKGVLVSHRNLASYLDGLGQVLDLAPLRSMAGLGSFAADLTYTALFAALAQGAALHVFEPAELKDGMALAQRLRARPVDLLKTVPSLVQGLLLLDPDGHFLPRSYLMMGGEALNPILLAALHKLSATCRYVNHYGPSETTIGVCLDVCDGAAAAWLGAGPSVIGVPFAPHLGIRVLDDDGRLRRIGETGEIWISGAGVSHGYWGSARLTAERFVPDVLAPALGTRQYCSGDLGRWLPDGRLEFLGRRDQQIKLRGFRIEPGDIESCLLQCADLTEAVVVALRDRQGEVVALAAFYTARSEVAELHVQDHCARLLPQQMQPAMARQLACLPRLSNGKIDRQALLALAAEGAPARPYSSPEAELIASELASLLGRVRMAEDENFFQLGGNSILAIRAVARLQTLFGHTIAPDLLFDYPTPLALAARMLQSNAEEAPALPVLVPLGRGSPLPMSLAQVRLWFAAKLLPPSTYHIPFVLELRGKLQPERIEAALAALVDRHEGLRMRVRDQEGTPSINFAEPGSWSWQWRDTGPAGTASLALQIAADTDRSFDFSAEGPLRAIFHHHDAHHASLHVVFHHLATDAWSHALFLRDFGALYRDGGASLPPLPLQYADYAAHEQACLAAADRAAGVAAWRSYLAGAPSRVALTPPQSYPATERAARLRRSVESASLPRFLHQLREAGLTANNGMSAVFALLMARVCDQSELVFGVPLTDRPHPDLQQLIGLFFHLLPLRVQIDNEASMCTLAGAIQHRMASLWQLNQFPFDAAAPALHASSDRVQPWFNVVFACRDRGDAGDLSTLLPGIQIELNRPEVPSSHFDLFFALELEAERLHFVIDFRADRLDEETVGHWLDCFLALLGQASERPHAPLHELRAGAPVLLAAPAAPASVPSTLATLAQSMKRDAGRDAVSASDGSVSYAQLDAGSAAVAAGLRAAGLTPGARVALAVPRQRHLITALIGIWRAGCVYVPLDQNQTPTRRNRIVEQAAPAIVVLSKLANAWNDARAPRVYLEDLLATPTDGVAPVAPRPDSAAYMMFTSGSTGAPKGVVVDWHALDHFLAGCAERILLREDDCMLCATTVGFDISLLEMLLPLSRGAALHIAPDDLWQHPANLASHLARVSVAQATPSAWQQALPYLDGVRLRLLLVGGEAVPGPLAAALAGHAQQTFSMYGPTEATVWMSTQEILAAACAGRHHVALGQPLPGMRWEILDAAGSPCPPGMPGELCIAGPQLAQGYWLLPALTADKFVPAASGQRSYRSGDRAVADAHGGVSFLGRNGGYLKLHGHRIEPGEIEAALQSHPAVAAAAVRVAGIAPHQQYLAAYLVAAAHAPVADEAWASQLRTHLLTTLPAYMVPAHFEPIDRLPVNSNGKLDRQALPVPSHALQCDGLDGAREEAVAAAFSRALGRPILSASADFFLNGGNSLLAARLCLDLGRRCGTTLSLRALFAGSTVRQVALQLDAIGPAGALPQIAPRFDPQLHQAPLSPYQEGIWLAQRRGDVGHTYNLNAQLLVQAELDPTRLAAAYQRMVQECDQLRIVVVEQDGMPVQQLVEADRACDFAYARIDCEHQGLDARALVRQHAVATHIEAASTTPFELGRPGHSRLRLYQLPGGQTLLLLVLHHLVADEWSWRLLFDRLQRLYLGDPPVTAPDTTRYLDFAAWIGGAQAQAWLQSQAAFWQARLAGRSPLLELEFARARPAKRRFRGAALDVTVPGALSTRLEQLATARGSSLFAILLAAYGWTLHHFAGRDEVVIGTAVANRRLPGIHEIVGNFANVLALPLQLAAADTVDALLTRAHGLLADALDHQEYPFGRLVGELGIRTSAAHAPLAQNFLVLHNTPKASVHADRWQVEVLAPEYSSSEYDLDLGLHHSEDGLRGYLRFNTDLYDARQLQGLLDYFIALCAHLCGPGHQKLDDFRPTHAAPSIVREFLL